MNLDNPEDLKNAINNFRQVTQAFLCPVNRAGTMEEHSCDDYGLFLHPEWLINHYNEYDGTKAFAKERERLIALAKIEPEYYL